ncbi:MAG: MATE family efflux transporter [Fusicatenibacter sp.]|nr:MATE family efflux transporter [Fusicatenibacter sp.]
MNRKLDKQFNKELMALAIPFALQGLLNALVGASDALMLGRLTQESIAAVSLANQISFVMSLFISAAVGAVGVLVAQYYGKEDYDSVRKLLCMALRYVFVIAVIFFALAFFAPEQLMRIFTDEAELIRIGAGYLKIVSFSYLFMGISQCYLMLMKVDGRAKVSVWISAVTVVVDMAADFFLIYGFGKIPALGANGSAYSTIAVEVIACAWCVLASFEKGRIHPDGRSMRFFSKQLEKDMLKVAFPMLASSLSWGLSISAHSIIIGHLGTDAVAAYSVTNVATSLIQCLSHGFAGGAGIMIGGLLGQNLLEKAKDYGRRFWNVSFLCGIANAVLLCIIGPCVYIFYVLEPLAKSYLVMMIAFNILYMFAYSFNTVFTCGVFPAGGDAIYDAVSVLIATWCFALPLSLIGCFVLHWPVMVVYIVMCMDEIVKVPFLYLRYKKYIWLKNLTREQA